MRATAPPDEDDGTRSPLARPAHVRLFGDLDLRLSDGRSAPVESARARSLLAFLLLHPDTAHPRQRLAFVLWPDSAEAQARTNLRKVLHNVRRDVPGVEECLEITTATLRWRSDESLWVDTAAFDAALAGLDEGTPGADPLEGLRTAVGLYRGDLLESCYDEWIVPVRERFRDRYMSALVRLAGLLEARGDHAEAIRSGRELLRRDPLHEDAYRLLMRTHDAGGDRAAAVRVYHECVSVLQRELGVEPSVATTEVYDALVHSAGPPAGAVPAPFAAGTTAMIGRDREWEQVRRVWAGAADGRAHLLVVTGEPGVGKTRLVEELSAWCTHRGALVAEARSYPTEGELGYGVVISWLRSDGVAPHVGALSPSDRLPVAPLVPELAGASGEPGPEPGPWDEAERRRRTFEAVARALTAPGRPTLLVADDAQWADTPSLQLVHYLLRPQVDRPVLVVVTARREDLAEGHPLASLIDGLQVLGRTTEVALGRLTREDTGALADRLGESEGSRTTDELYAETEGNPLFIVEAVRAAREQDGAGGPTLSPRLQALIGGRLQQCSETTRELLGVAATVGRAFTVDLVRVASGADDSALVRALDELWRRGMIRERDADAYDFSHGQIRTVAYNALSPAARRHNHRLVADALLRLHAHDPEPVSGQVALHLDHAGRVDEAITWYRRAAAEAQRRNANPEALRLLDRARELAGTLGGDTGLRRELEILSILPTPLVAVDGFASERLADAQRRAIEVAGVLGVEPEPPLLRSLVITSLCHDDFHGARTAAERLLAAAHRAGDTGFVAEAGYLLGIAAFWGAELVAARAHFEAVVAGFGPEERDEHLVRFGSDPGIVCLSRLGNTFWFLGHPDQARRTADRAVAAADDLGHRLSAMVAHTFAALLAVDAGDSDGVGAHVAALSREPNPSPPSAEVTQALQGYLEVRAGRPAPGLARIRSAIDRSGPVNSAPGARATLHRVLLAAHERAGDPGPGLDAVDGALRLAGTRLWEAEARRLRAEFLAASGAARREVEAELTRAAAVALAQGALGLERRVRESRTRLLGG